MSVRWLTQALCISVIGALCWFEPSRAQDAEDDAESTEFPAEAATLDSDSAMCDLARLFLKNIYVECHANYQLYQPQSVTIDPSVSAIKIGQWNVFNLGMDKQRFKDLEILADLIKKENWDVFAATELFPLSTSIVNENQRLASYIDDLIGGNGNALQVKEALAQFQWHGAVRLLQALQKNDPSWALVLAPKSLGSEGSSALETGGIYYRASRVKPVNTEFCGTIACLVTLPSKIFPGIPADLLSEIVSREPFMASFATHSGKFDFTVLPFHARFRHPKKQGIMEAITGATVASDGTVSYGPGLFFDMEAILGKIKSDAFKAKLATEIQDRLSGKLTGAEKKDSTKELLARYAELSALGRFMNYLKSSSKEQDVVWTGDFNLEYDLDPNADTVAEKKLRSDWDFILLQNPKGWPGAKVLVEERTSISDKERLKSNYDHFVIDPKSTTECSPKTAKAVDFTNRMNAPLMERYTVLLNEKTYGDDYDRAEPISVTNLIELAVANPTAFEALTSEQKLGMSFLDARSLGELKLKDRTAYEERKLELEEIMLDLKRRKMEAHLNSSAGAIEKQKIQRRIADHALVLQGMWGVYDDTLNGNTQSSYQPKYPQGDATRFSPERQKRAKEYDKIVADFARRVFDSQWMIDPRTAKDIRYQVYREMISDHIPIDMECALPARDDD